MPKSEDKKELLKEEELPEITITEASEVKRSLPKPKSGWIGYLFDNGLLLFFIGSIVIGYGISYFALTNFPRALEGKDEKTYPDAFIAGNAFNHVFELAQNIGPRLTGTENNEVKAVKYLLSEINKIKATASRDVKIEVAHDINDGAFLRSSKLYTVQQQFRGIQNVVVRLSPVGGNETSNSILVNAHIDTVPQGPGAGDDAQMCAVMLELLRVLSRRRILDHAVVFLFNGAEEQGLIGSYAFIANNPWAKNIGAIINLEASGAGGKEALFQVRYEYTWLHETYKKCVKDPYASVMYQELFNKGIIQSDTDFTAFSKFLKNVPAYGFAQGRDGYTYHTQYDDIFTIPLGSLQNTGENILNLIKGLDKVKALDDFLPTYNEGAAVVWYDILGKITLLYTAAQNSSVVNIVGVITIVISVIRSIQIQRVQKFSRTRTFLEFLAAHVIQLLSIVFGAAGVYGISYLLDKFGNTLSWYANPWMIFGLYFSPFVFLSTLLPLIYLQIRKLRYSTVPTLELHVLAQGNLLAIIGFVLANMAFQSDYIILLILIPHVLAGLANLWVKAKENYWIFLYSIGHLGPAIYVFYILNILLQTLIPGQARAYDGQTKNPETNIALFTALCTFLGTVVFGPVLLTFRRRSYVVALFGIFTLVFFGLTYTSVGFPFRYRTATQRYTIWHTRRQMFTYNGTLRKEDAGYYVFAYDKRGASTVKDDIPEFANAYIPAEDCVRSIACAQPWYRPMYAANAAHNLYIPAKAPPPQKVATSFKLVSAVPISDTLTNYTFSYSGPAMQNIQLSPVPGVNFKQWSFGELAITGQWLGRNYYFINYVHGISKWNGQESTWWLVAERTPARTKDYNFDLAYSAIFIDDSAVKSPEFTSFIDKFPEWTNVQDWVATVTTYQYQ